MKSIAQILAEKTAATTPATTPPHAAEASPTPAAAQTFSFYSSAFAKDPCDVLTLDQLIARIRSGEWRGAVEQLRKQLSQGGRMAYDQAKRNLPAVSFSIRSETRRAGADKEVTHSGWLQGDFDGKDHALLLDEEATDPRERVKPLLDLVRADPHVQAAFVSPSGEGVKAVIKVPAAVETHRGAWEAAAEHFRQFGLKLDPATKDVGRLCFVSYDPEAWINPRAAKMIKPKKERARTGIDHAVLDTTAADIREMLSFIPPRPAYDDWLRIASAVWSVVDEITGASLLNEWSPEESPGEYLRKYRHRLKEVRVGTLAWYAQAGGFDPREAARKKMWCGRIRFGAPGAEATVEAAPDHVDGPSKRTECDGDETADNASFVRWCLDHEQLGDAELWRALSGGRRKFDHYLGRWREFDGRVWKRDDLGRTMDAFAREVSAVYQAHADALAEDMRRKPAADPKSDPRAAERKLIAERIKKLHRTGWLNGCLEFARSIPDLASKADQFDRDPYLLALENGVIDFRAGEFREAHPSDLLTHQASVRFDPAATCPNFDAFLSRAMGDDELERFCLRAMAYSLTGLTDEDRLFFCYGKGSNGKSTFVNIFRMMLGELMVTIDIDTLLLKKSDQNADYKKAMLEGQRVAVTDEVPEGRQLSESMVKALIGGDHILARRPYEKPYSFAPTHKLWMVGNHKPAITGTDLGIWRRICLIPWMRTIPEAEKKPRAQIMAEMRAEMPGILNRLLLAWLEIQELGGLCPPAVVLEATSEYQADQDQLGAFLAERTEPDLASSVRAAQLLKAYLAWCEDNGERPVRKTSKALVTALRERGAQIGLDRNKCTTVEGIALLGAE